ncbi:hypothetical protein ACMFMG_000140 [Clarireedia jacksonii]
MPSATHISFYLPLVDITPWKEDPKSAAAQRVIDDVRVACKSTGFFQLKGHGVPPTLQKSIFEAAARFFALPSDFKFQIDRRKNAFRGYDVMGAQSYEDSIAEAVRDMKEGFLASTDLLPNRPRVVQGRFLQGPNNYERLAIDLLRLPTLDCAPETTATWSTSVVHVALHSKF